MSPTEPLAPSAIYGREPRQWGRWGDEDEIGRANLLDPAAVLRAAACIRTGKRFSLALPICSPRRDPCMPGRMEAVHFITRDERSYADGRDSPSVGGMKSAEDCLFIACHGTTHMDALGHAYVGDELYNGHPARSADGRVRRASIEALARQGVVGRAVLVDLARHEGASRLEMHRQVRLGDIERALTSQRVNVLPGDVLVLRTGIFRLFYEEGAAAFYEDFDEPGISYEPELVSFMMNQEIVGLATDTLCNEQPYSATVGAAFPMHVLLQRNLGISFHEALWLEDWADDCAADGVYDAFYIAAPLRLTGGTGAPMNPIAIK